MVKGDLSLNGRSRNRAFCELVFLFLCEELKDALGSCGHGLEHIGHLCHLGDGLGEVAHVLDKGLDITDLNGTGSGQNGAEHGHSNIAQVTDKLHDGLHEAGEKLRLPRRLVQFFVGLAELVEHGLLAVECAHDVMA